HTGQAVRYQDAKAEIDYAPQLVVETEGDVAPGDTVTVKGSHFNPNQAVYVILCEDADLDTVTFNFAMPCRTGALQVGTASSSSPLKFDANGAFETSFTVNPTSSGVKAIY